MKYKSIDFKRKWNHYDIDIILLKIIVFESNVNLLFEQDFDLEQLYYYLFYYSKKYLPKKNGPKKEQFIIYLYLYGMMHILINLIIIYIIRLNLLIIVMKI